METTPTFAGIDWSWQHHAVCVIDDQGRRVEEVTVAHSRPGLNKITCLLRRHGVERVGIERGDGPVVEHLIRDGFEPDTPETVALRMLVRTRHDLIGHRIAVHNQLLATLQHNFPGAIGLFSQLDIGISLAFLRRFPSEAKAAWLIAGGGELRMTNWLKANSYCGRHTSRRLVDHLTNAATGRVTGAAAEASELIVLTLVDLLTDLRHQQELLETRIRETLLTHPDGPIFQSLPRAGTIRAATLLAEIGDCRARFPDPEALAAAAGVAPSTRQSGKHRHVAYRRGCNKQLRAALIDWVQDTPRANTWARDTYDRARQRGCRHPHAARILAQAWTRVLWRCWHDHQPYDPNLHRGLTTLQQEAA